MPRLKRLSSVWGSPLAQQIPEAINGVPIIVRRLTEQIELEGLECEVSYVKGSSLAQRMCQGLYRVTGVKSQVESLCAEFETNPRGVVIAGVVKTDFG